VPLSLNPAGMYLAEPGGRYAVLLSVDSRASLTDVTGALGKESFQVSYAWQSGQPVRNQFFVDTWLAGLPAPTAGTVWMYFEMSYTGDTPLTFARHIEKCILFICGSADIAYAFSAQSVPDNTSPCGPGDPQTGTCAPLPPPCPGCPPKPVPWKPALAGAGVGAGIAILSWLVAR